MASRDALQTRYFELKQEAARKARKAGGLLEIPRRVAILCDMFQDSGGNHVFPLIAAHGALWAFSDFEMGGSLGRLIATRFFLPCDFSSFATLATRMSVLPKG